MLFHVIYRAEGNVILMNSLAKFAEVIFELNVAFIFCSCKSCLCEHVSWYYASSQLLKDCSTATLPDNSRFQKRSVKSNTICLCTCMVWNPNRTLIGKMRGAYCEKNSKINSCFLYHVNYLCFVGFFLLFLSACVRCYSNFALIFRLLDLWQSSRWVLEFLIFE